MKLGSRMVAWSRSSCCVFRVYLCTCLRIEGGFDGEAATLKNVSVDHGGFDILVAEEFLDSANVVTGLEEMGGETVAKGVRGDVFVDFCEVGGFSDGFLFGGFAKMMAAGNSSTRVFGKISGGKEVLPDPIFVGVFVFAFEGIGQVDGAKAFGEVFYVKGFDVAQVKAQRFNDGIREDGNAVIFAFAVADDDGVVVEVNVFDAQAHTFHYSKPAAIHHLGDQFVNAGHVCKDALDFILR